LIGHSLPREWPSARLPAYDEIFKGVPGAVSAAPRD